MRKRARVKRAAKPARKAARAAASAKAAVDLADGARDSATGRFGPSNRFWRTRASSGPEPLFPDGDALWAACDAYFCWAEDNPILEEQLVTYRGATRFVSIPKMRPMTKRGLCRFLGVAHTTWAKWKRDRPELAAAIERAEGVLWDQKFAGAAVGIFNGNLVARELGLADKTELMGKDGGPIQHQDLEPKLPSREVCLGWGGHFLENSPAARRLKNDN